MRGEQVVRRGVTNCLSCGGPVCRASLPSCFSLPCGYTSSCCASQDGQPAPDDPIDAVTQQLQSMGFDDEGGWLTELVRARGGDIDKVLETLHWEK